MATIKVRWHVNELENVMTLFDVMKVHRSPTGEEGSFVEITTEGTRVPLVAGVENYLYDDTAGDPTYYYAISYYNSATTEASNLSDAKRGDLSSYISLADIRNEGFTESMVGDEAVIRGIERATATVDHVTRQWFTPKVRTFTLDGRPGEELPLNVPIIAITAVEIDGTAYEVSDFIIYNRHLTQGLLAPDDRNHPRIAWANADYTSSYLSSYGARQFLRKRAHVKLTGVFGYTELGMSETPAETEAGSQVPVSYGETPGPIKYATTLLSIQYMHSALSGDGVVFSNRRRVVEERTRDQNYRLSDASAWNAADIYGFTGDIEVDQILSSYMAPLDAGAI